MIERNYCHECRWLLEWGLDARRYHDCIEFFDTEGQPVSCNAVRQKYGETCPIFKPRKTIIERLLWMITKERQPK